MVPFILVHVVAGFGSSDVFAVLVGKTVRALRTEAVHRAVIQADVDVTLTLRKFTGPRLILLPVAMLMHLAVGLGLVGQHRVGKGKPGQQGQEYDGCDYCFHALSCHHGSLRKQAAIMPKKKLNVALFILIPLLPLAPRQNLLANYCMIFAGNRWRLERTAKLAVS